MKALTKAFKAMEDTSEEECRKLMNVSFAIWIDKNVEAPTANMVLYLFRATQFGL